MTTMNKCKERYECNGDCGIWCSAFYRMMHEYKVKDMFEAQKELQAEMFGYKLPEDSVEDFKYSVLALISELGEVLEADKRWKNVRTGEVRKEEKLEELVDCMAFLVNMILFSGFSSDEFVEAFMKKNQKNFERFRKEKEKEKEKKHEDSFYMKRFTDCK